MPPLVFILKSEFIKHALFPVEIFDEFILIHCGTHFIYIKILKPHLSKTFCYLSLASARKFNFDYPNCLHLAK